MELSLLGHEIANTAHANDSQGEGCKKLRFGVDRTAEKTLVPRDIATMQHPRGDVPQNAHYVVEHIGVAAKLCFGNEKSNPTIDFERNSVLPNAPGHHEKTSS